METTLTIRLSKKQRDALNRRARAEGRSASAVIRDLLERETTGGFDFERVRHLAGSVRIDRKKMKTDAWAEYIRRMNWRK
jgi:predicted transcriptional regulator